MTEAKSLSGLLVMVDFRRIESIPSRNPETKLVMVLIMLLIFRSRVIEGWVWVRASCFVCFLRGLEPERAPEVCDEGEFAIRDRELQWLQVGNYYYLDPKSDRWLHPSIRCGASAEAANGTSLFQWNLSRRPLSDASPRKLERFVPLCPLPSRALASLVRGGEEYVCTVLTVVTV